MHALLVLILTNGLVVLVYLRDQAHAHQYALLVMLLINVLDVQVLIENLLTEAVYA
jgi:hypothetical protein